MLSPLAVAGLGHSPGAWPWTPRGVSCFQGGGNSGDSLTPTPFPLLAVRFSRRSVACRWGPAISLTVLRSEEHTSELQSQSNLVCRLLLEKKKKKKKDVIIYVILLELYISIRLSV